MTREEYFKLRKGDRVRVARTHTAYDPHFGLDDILVLREDPTVHEHLKFEWCPRKERPGCQSSICDGEWAILENFEVYVISAEELSTAGDMTKPVDPEELTSLFK